LCALHQFKDHFHGVSEMHFINTIAFQHKDWLARFFAKHRHILDNTQMTTLPTDSATGIYVPFTEFCAGLPLGRFRVIVNPEKAQKYIKHRLFIVGIALPLLGIGAALAISGYVWVGLPMVVVGALLPRVVKAHAPKILLHLAQQDAKTYQESIDFEIMEVRNA
jgi:hypothetical protein